MENSVEPIEVTEEQFKFLKKMYYEFVIFREDFKEEGGRYYILPLHVSREDIESYIEFVDKNPNNMWFNFDVYMDAVLKRNEETIEEGHLIEFNYPEDIILSNKEHFRKCWENHTSPYKALTFLS